MKNTAHQAVKAVRCVKADAHGVGAVNGPDIDGKGFGEALFAISLDDMGAAGTATFKVQEADPDPADDTIAGTYAGVTSAAFLAVKSAVGYFVGRVNLEARKRFVRGVLTIAANAVDASVGATLFPNKNLPVTQVATAEFNV